MQSSSQIVAINKPTANILQDGCHSCHPTNSVSPSTERNEVCASTEKNRFDYFFNIFVIDCNGLHFVMHQIF